MATNRLNAVITAFATLSVLLRPSVDTLEAHAKLLRAEPAPGSTVKVAPKLVRVWFTDELNPERSAITIWNGQGRRVDDGKGGVDLDDMDRKSMVARLKTIGPGTYTVRWKAVSADDLDVAQRTFRFNESRR